MKGHFGLWCYTFSRPGAWVTLFRGLHCETSSITALEAVIHLSTHLFTVGDETVTGEKQQNIKTGDATESSIWGRLPFIANNTAMASSALHATPEHWTELIAARKQSSLCSEQINVIKKECAEKCGKKQILECPTCYGKAIERMRERYNEGKDREWFTQRTAFLHELDGLLTDAKEHRNGVKLIEARIESEKEAWYRWVLRKYPEFLAVSDDGAHLEELRGMLDDPDRSREELVAMMWQGVGKPAGWSDGVDRFAAKVAAAGGDKAELKKLYISEFFMNQDTNEVLEYAKPYLDEYSASDTMRLEEIMGKLAQDSQESKSTQPQRDSHISRLDDLRRARTAYEQNKAQLKSRQQKAQGPTAGEDLYNLPPCLVCRKPANAADVLSCSVCQAVTQMGGIKKLTVYCSEECYHKGHVRMMMMICC